MDVQYRSESRWRNGVSWALELALGHTLGTQSDARPGASNAQLTVRSFQVIQAASASPFNRA